MQYIALFYFHGLFVLTIKIIETTIPISFILEAVLKTANFMFTNLPNVFLYAHADIRYTESAYGTRQVYFWCKFLASRLSYRATEEPTVTHHFTLKYMQFIWNATFTISKWFSMLLCESTGTHNRGERHASCSHNFERTEIITLVSKWWKIEKELWKKSALRL